MKRWLLPLLALAAYGGGACSCGAGAGSAPAEAPPPPSRLHFSDGTTASGLDAFVHRNGSADNRTIDESFGAGVALFDADGDGDLDAYLCNGGDAAGNGAPNAFFRGDGEGHFVEATEEAGFTHADWSYGALARDVDGDGDTDLYVTNRGANRLYRNVDGRFEDVAAELGVDDPRWSTGAAWFDYDRDGDLDLYVANHIELDRAAAARKPQDFFGLKVYFGPLGLEAQPDALYRQEDDGSFSDVSTEMGIDAVAFFSFQVVTFDWDGDGWLDLYVANDSTPNLLWHNQEGKGFVDVAKQCHVALSVSGDPQAGMGVAVGDANGDGREDLYVTNFSEDYFTLYQRGAGDQFRDVTAPSGLYRVTLASLGWAALFEDFDADGDADLFVANGHVFPQVDELGRQTAYRQENQLFENEGAGRFRVPTGGGGPGMAVLAASRGSAAGDVDGDGDLDVLVGNLDGPPTLLVNESEVGSSLALNLIGSGRNRDAIGAVVRGRVGARHLVHTIGAGSGFLSTGDLRPTFGLGEATTLEGVSVRWPDGSEMSIGELAAGQLHTLTQGQGVSASTPRKP
ncbi:MAG: CRTAC1 family protein [Planctomycetota bacterium]|nr:CRTAC1 family protein [Planctomycetota bacterium]